MTVTVSAAEFRRNMPTIIGKAEEAGTCVTVIRNSRPWFEIRPISVGPEFTDETAEAIAGFDAVRNDPDARGYKDVDQFFASLGL